MCLALHTYPAFPLLFGCSNHERDRNFATFSATLTLGY